MAPVPIMPTLMDSLYSSWINGRSLGQAIGLKFLERFAVEPVAAFVDLRGLPGGVFALQPDAVGARCQLGQFGVRGQRAPGGRRQFRVGQHRLSQCPLAIVLASGARVAGKFHPTDEDLAVTLIHAEMDSVLS